MLLMPSINACTLFSANAWAEQYHKTMGDPAPRNEIHVYACQNDLASAFPQFKQDSAVFNAMIDYCARGVRAEDALLAVRSGGAVVPGMHFESLLALYPKAEQLSELQTAAGTQTTYTWGSKLIYLSNDVVTMVSTDSR